MPSAIAQAISDQYMSEGLAIRPDYHGRLAELAHPDILAKLFEALSDGNYPSVAARIAGINPTTYHRWMRLAEDEPGSAYAAFSHAVKEAECAAEGHIVRNIKKASDLPQFWAAGMTLLERKYPDRWGRRQDDQSVPKVVVQIGVGNGDVTVKLGTFASQDATVSDDLHRLTEAHESDNTQLCIPSALALPLAAQDVQHTSQDRPSTHHAAPGRTRTPKRRGKAKPKRTRAQQASSVQNPAHGSPSESQSVALAGVPPQFSVEQRPVGRSGRKKVSPARGE